jgi:hypothetical protein
VIGHSRSTITQTWKNIIKSQRAWGSNLIESINTGRGSQTWRIGWEEGAAAECRCVRSLSCSCSCYLQRLSYSSSCNLRRLSCSSSYSCYRRRLSCSCSCSWWPSSQSCYISSFKHRRKRGRMLNIPFIVIDSIWLLYSSWTVHFSSHVRTKYK